MVAKPGPKPVPMPTGNGGVCPEAVMVSVSDADKDFLKSAAPVVPEEVFQDTRPVYSVRGVDGRILMRTFDVVDANFQLEMHQNQWRALGGKAEDIKLLTRTEVVRQYLDDWHEV